MVTLLLVNIVVAETCPKDGVWPETNEGQIASIDCGSGLYGKQQRVCRNKDGIVEWEEAFDKNCRIIFYLSFF